MAATIVATSTKPSLHKAAPRPRADPRATGSIYASAKTTLSGRSLASPNLRARNGRTAQLKVSAVNQAEEMKQAELRWNNQIRDGRVRSVSGKEAAKMFKSGVPILDVRPAEEVSKVSVPGSINVPLFMVDDDMSLGGLMKQMSAFGMGGWWLGGQHMKPNNKFLPTVLAAVPDKDQPVIVACQKGLRSLASCEQLSRAGYTSISWLNGGFDTVQKDDGIPTSDGQDLRYAGIGGVSSMLGWTEVQQDEASADESNSKLGSVENVIKGLAFVVFLDILLFGYEFITATPP